MQKAINDGTLDTERAMQHMESLQKSITKAEGLWSVTKVDEDDRYKGFSSTEDGENE